MFNLHFTVTVLYCSAVFLKLLASADHYMGERRTRGPLGHFNIPPSREEDSTALSSGNRRQIIVKVTMLHAGRSRVRFPMI
jgi:hypothetical protein